MAETSDDLENLLTDVRRTISENRLFLVKLGDETFEDEVDDNAEVGSVEEDFVQL